MFQRLSLLTRVHLLSGVLTLYAYAVYVVDLHFHHLKTPGSTLHSLLALVLGGLLVFRTNTAYDRWWEGRKLWGQLVNDCRNFAIKVQACVQTAAAEKQLLLRKLVSFCFALKEHLREGSPLRSHDGYSESTETPSHVPAYIARDIYSQLEKWRAAEKLGNIELLFLDTHAASLMNICGACERIRKTPIAPSWRTAIRQIIGIYLLTLPWALVEGMGHWAVVITFFVAYFMIVLEAIAESIEEPFGTDEDDLKLDELCAGIRASVLEIGGGGQVPR